MAGEHLKRITQQAKALRRKHPKMSWQDAIKKSSAFLKKSVKVVRVSDVKKKPILKKVVKTTKKTVRYSRLSGVGSLTQEIATVKRYEQLLVAEKGKTIRGMSATEKRDHKNWMNFYRTKIASTKKNISQIKKLL